MVRNFQEVVKRVWINNEKSEGLIQSSHELLADSEGSIEDSRKCLHVIRQTRENIERRRVERPSDRAR